MKLPIFIVLTFKVLFVVCDVQNLEEFDESVDIQWKKFKATYKRQFNENSNEEARRRLIFKENFDYITEHNRQTNMGKFSYRLRMNHFGDLSLREMEVYMTSLAKGETNFYKEAKQYDGATNDFLPPDMDYRRLGAVTAVKDQKSCNAGYAFALVGVLESIFYFQTNVLTSLSAQQVIDCSRFYGNQGCNGGNIVKTAEYVFENGIQQTFSYEYAAKELMCHYSKDKISFKPTYYKAISSGDQRHLMFAIAGSGPVAVSIKTCVRPFLFYGSGVYAENYCFSNYTYHDLLVIGYDKDYWLLKNSYGTDWGEDGYIRMSRNSSNQLGIASRAVTVDV